MARKRKQERASNTQRTGCTHDQAALSETPSYLRADFRDGFSGRILGTDFGDGFWGRILGTDFRDGFSGGIFGPLQGSVPGGRIFETNFEKALKHLFSLRQNSVMKIVSAGRGPGCALRKWCGQHLLSPDDCKSTSGVSALPKSSESVMLSIFRWVLGQDKQVSSNGVGFL